MRENYGPYVKCTDRPPGVSPTSTYRNRIIPEPPLLSTKPPCENQNIDKKEYCETSWVPRKNQRTDQTKPYGCVWGNESCIDNDGESTCSYLNVGKSCGELNEQQCENIYNETKCLWNDETRSCSQDIEWARKNASCSKNNWGCGKGEPPQINLCGYSCIHGEGPFPNSTELCNPHAPNFDQYVFCEPPYNKCRFEGDPNFPQNIRCCNGKGECR